MRNNIRKNAAKNKEKKCSQKKEIIEAPISSLVQLEQSSSNFPIIPPINQNTVEINNIPSASLSYLNRQHVIILNYQSRYF